MITCGQIIFKPFMPQVIFTCKHLYLKPLLEAECMILLSLQFFQSNSISCWQSQIMASQDEGDIPASQPDVVTPKEKAPPSSPPRTPMKRPARASSAKASPKASAKKATGKAKAKGKALAKPKAVTKHTLKRPAASIPKKGKKEKDTEGTDTEKTTKSLKRPAASEDAALKAGKKNTWKDGINEEKDTKKEDTEDPEEEQQGFEEDPIVESKDTQTRDRSKMQKFHQMLGARQLPDFVMQEWQATLSMKTGKRERQSLIVNSLFDRSAAGRLLVNTDKPVFHAMKESYTDRSSKDTERSLSKRLFKGKFGLTDQDLREGVEEGEFIEVQTERGPMYSWNETTVTNKKGEKSAMGWKAESTGKKADFQKYDNLAGTWKVGIPFQPLGSAASSNPSKGPLALMDADSPLTDAQWKTAQVQMTQGLEALSKLEKLGMKHLESINHCKSDPLYEVLHLGRI